MSIRFNANEVFEMAMQIERNGRDFYKRAAEMQSSADVQHQLNSLSQMEAIHEKLFARMQEEVVNAFAAMHDPDDEALSYLQELVQGEIFVLSDHNDFFESSPTLSDILKRAIQLEKDSIVFYTGIRDAVPENLGREKIDDIIREEQRHILLLSNRLKTVSEGTV